MPPKGRRARSAFACVEPLDLAQQVTEAAESDVPCRYSAEFRLETLAQNHLARNKGRGLPRNKYALKPATTPEVPGTVEFQKNISGGPACRVSRSSTRTQRWSDERYPAAFSSSRSRMPVAASRISLSTFRLEAIASASGMEMILFPRKAAILPNSPRCTMSIAPRP